MTTEAIVFISNLFAFFAGYGIHAAKSRHAIRRAHYAGIREMEELHRQRAIQDRRDNTSARITQ